VFFFVRRIALDRPGRSDPHRIFSSAWPDRDQRHLRVGEIKMYPDMDPEFYRSIWKCLASKHILRMRLVLVADVSPVHTCAELTTGTI